MNRFLLVLVSTILSCSFWGKGQNVYITISAEIDSTVLDNQTTNDDCQCHLKITYENNTDTAIYFEKVMKDVQMENEIGVPQFIGGGLYNPPKTTISTIDYSNDSIIITIPLGPNQRWSAYSNITFSSSSIIHVLEEDLEIYYDQLYHNSYPNKTYTFSNELIQQAHSSGHYKELVNDFIENQTDSLAKYSDFFVFLKPKETYSDYFDMSGFIYFRGHYSFMIRDNYWHNSIIIEEKYDEVLKRGIQVTKPFPESIGIYKLYTGPIESNVLSVDF